MRPIIVLAITRRGMRPPFGRSANPRGRGKCCKTFYKEICGLKTARKAPAQGPKSSRNYEYLRTTEPNRRLCKPSTTGNHLRRSKRRNRANHDDLQSFQMIHTRHRSLRSKLDKIVPIGRFTLAIPGQTTASKAPHQAPGSTAPSPQTAAPESAPHGAPPLAVP